MAEKWSRWDTRPTWLSWSGGKESAWALRELRRDPAIEVRGLVSLVNEKNGRVMVHGVRHTLLQRQAEAVGLPLRFVPVDWTSSRGERRAAVARAFGRLRADGAAVMAFGDLVTLERRDRRRVVNSETGLDVALPLRGRDTSVHAAEMLAAGISAWVCSVDTGSLPANRTGRRFNTDFVSSLPEDADPCGGRGEYHTFVEWAPGWEHRVLVEPSRSLEVYDFSLTELVPVENGAGLGDRADDEAGGDAISSDGSPLPGRVDPFSHFARLDRVRSHVDQRIAEQLDLGAVAAVAAMSPSGFGRFFREHVGTTFAIWLGRRRVEHACRLLHDTDVPVSRIAEAVGFGSERTFRRGFHEQMDTSPSEYRKQSLSG